MKPLFCIIFIFLIFSSYATAQDTRYGSAKGGSLVTQDLYSRSQTGPGEHINTIFSADSINHDLISRLPERGLENYMLLLPGVQEQDGVLSIRGGSHQAIGYFIGESMVLNNPAGGPPVYIIPEALSEVRVFSSGNSARYGLAASGMVFSGIKTGSGGFNLGLNYQTDKFAGEGDPFLGTYSYRDQIIVATLSGTTWEDRFRFFAAAENVQSGDWIRRFSSGFSFNGLVDTYPLNQNVMKGTPDTVSLWYPDGFTPGNSLDQMAVNSRLDVVFEKIHIKLIGLYLDRKKYDLDIPMLDMLNSRKFYFETGNTFLSGVVSHTVSDAINYDIGITFYNHDNERFDDYFGNNWQAWSDSALISRHTGGAVNYRSRWRPEYDYRLLGIPFNRTGDLNGPYIKGAQQSWSVEAAVNLNLIRDHRLSAGLFRMGGSTRRYEINSVVMQEWEKYNFSADVPAAVFAPYLGPTYGYDIFGNETGDGLNGPREQDIFSAFIEDYFGSDALRFQVGLRADYLKDNRRFLRDPANPIIDPETNTIAASEWIEKDGEWQFSPRIGAEFRINNHFSAGLDYARFVQSSLTTSPVMQEPVSSHLFDANVTYLHGLFDINLRGFTKNINGYPAVQQQAGGFIIDNSDEAAIRGLEFRFNLHRIGRLLVRLNYTLIDTEGSDAGEAIYYGAVYPGTQAQNITAPLDFIQSHRGTVILDYHFDAGDGGAILERSGLNVVFNFNSGHPYTPTYAPPGGQNDPYTAGVDYLSDPRARQALAAVNSSRTPWNFYLNLQLDKAFNIFNRVDATVFIRIINVLNTKNVRNVYHATGSAGDDGYISDPQRYASNENIYGPQYLDLYRAVNIENGQSYWDQLGRQLYGQPRQIFFGLELSY